MICTHNIYTHNIYIQQRNNMLRTRDSFWHQINVFWYLNIMVLKVFNFSSSDICAVFLKGRSIEEIVLMSFVKPVLEMLKGHPYGCTGPVQQLHGLWPSLLYIIFLSVFAVRSNVLLSPLLLHTGKRICSVLCCQMKKDQVHWQSSLSQACWLSAPWSFCLR